MTARVVWSKPALKFALLKMPKTEQPPLAVSAKEQKDSLSPKTKKKRDLSSEPPLDGSDEDFEVPSYSNAGKEHTIEHVYDLSLKSLRVKHWKECLGFEALAEQCAEGELLDCLSTVTLAWAGKDYGTETTEEQLRALRLDLPGQVPDDRYCWEITADKHCVDGLLDVDLLKKTQSPLEACYRSKQYLYEAGRRVRAVDYVSSKIPAEKRRELLNSDPYVQLVFDKLSTEVQDPRRELLESVAIYHWFLKSDVLNLKDQFALPLV